MNIKIDTQGIEYKTIANNINFKNKAVLEIGCGDGSFSIKFEKICKSWLGIDIDSKGIMKARKQNTPKMRFEQQNFLASRLKANFNIIFMRLSFHEIGESNMEKILLKSKLLLKRNGKIVIVDPQFGSELQELFNYFYKEEEIEHDKRLIKSREVLDELIAENTLKSTRFFQYNVSYTFTDFRSLIEFISQYWNFPKESVKQAKENIRKALGTKAQNKPLTVYDQMNLFVLST
ncbi:MAG: class I SAM-dependent methyltransferase [Patescibacteria group bacterium]|nr:class I SAM-dependent methyltransferase [Patescibacteria group bacterium]